MKTKNTSSIIKSKKPYMSPVLKRFGAVKELTTGGSPGPPEGVVLPPQAPPLPRRP